MYHPYMSASDLSLVVDHHTKLAAKGHILHERIRANIAPVLLAKALNAKPVNRWNPSNAQMSLLKRTSGNIFFDYVSVAAAALPAYSLARDNMPVRHCFFLRCPSICRGPLSPVPSEQRGECAVVLCGAGGYRWHHVQLG
jgi:hypothetical protein